MVQQNPDVVVPAPAEERSFLPRRAQPWELASLFVGIPGAMASPIVLSLVLVYAARGDALVAACVGLTVVGGYLTTMAVLGLGVASERP